MTQSKSNSEITKPSKEQIAKNVCSLNSGESSALAGFNLAKDIYVTPNGTPTFTDVESWSGAISIQTKELNEGKFDCLIGRLNGHMVLMESAFIKLLLLANGTTKLEQISKLGTLAMKIQSNMRNTAQTICDLKHPRQQVNFVRAETANVSNGPQQNNITNQATPANAHVNKSENQQNELLEVGNGLDR